MTPLEEARIEWAVANMHTEECWTALREAREAWQQAERREAIMLAQFRDAETKEAAK